MVYKEITLAMIRDAVNDVFLYRPLIKYWSKVLGVDNYSFKTEQIDREQVTFPEDIEEEDRYFVGISVEGNVATITHDRGLMEEDILHEILHLAYPDKSEDWINKETFNKLKNKKI